MAVSNDMDILHIRLNEELLRFYDELTEFHAGGAFLVQAMASALVWGEGLDKRTATGAVFIAQWLAERTDEVEGRLRDILSRARGLETPVVSGASPDGP